MESNQIFWGRVIIVQWKVITQTNMQQRGPYMCGRFFRQTSLWRRQQTTIDKNLLKRSSQGYFDKDYSTQCLLNVKIRQETMRLSLGDERWGAVIKTDLTHPCWAQNHFVGNANIWQYGKWSVMVVAICEGAQCIERRIESRDRLTSRSIVLWGDHLRLNQR